MKYEDTKLRLYWHTKKQAEAFDRRVYNVKPEHGLGWTPYTILVRSNYGTMGYWACHKTWELRAKFPKSLYQIRITGRFAEDGRGNRCATIYKIVKG